jgi:PQQ-like domain
MAANRAFARVQAVFGLLGVIALVVTYAIITGWNPLPGWGNWLANVSAGPLSKPATTWVKRAGNEPNTAAVVNNFVIVATKGSVETRSLFTGEKMWSKPADWAVVAGADRPVVLVGRPAQKGFDVYDVTTGILQWQKTENLGVWAYADRVLLLHCSNGTCVLQSVDWTTGKESPGGWHLTLSGTGQPLIGAGHGLTMLDPISSDYGGSLTATPGPVPDMIALTLAGKMHIIRTGPGVEIKPPIPVTARSRPVLAGHVVVTASSDFRDGKCFYAVSGTDLRTGRSWSEPNFDTKTSGGLQCDERHDPVGGGGAIYAVNPSGRDVLLSASTGSVLYTAKAKTHIEATDGDIAIVRSADKKSLSAVKLSSGNTLWTRGAAASTMVAVTSGAVLLTDPATEHLAAVAPSNAYALLDLKSGATVLGLGAHELIINIGRSFGPIAMSSGP